MLLIVIRLLGWWSLLFVEIRVIWIFWWMFILVIFVEVIVVRFCGCSFWLVVRIVVFLVIFLLVLW